MDFMIRKKIRRFFSRFFGKMQVFGEKKPFIISHCIIYLYILPKLIAIPTLKANRAVLNVPLTFVCPLGVLVLISFINASTFGLSFRLSGGIFAILLLRLPSR
jgi:hypothetical protein